MVAQHATWTLTPVHPEEWIMSQVEVLQLRQSLFDMCHCTSWSSECLQTIHPRNVEFIVLWLFQEVRCPIVVSFLSITSFLSPPLIFLWLKSKRTPENTTKINISGNLNKNKVAQKIAGHKAGRGCLLFEMWNFQLVTTLGGGGVGLCHCVRQKTPKSRQTLFL